MSLLPKQPCLRCKPIVDGLKREVERNSRIGGFSEAIKALSNLITEDPAGFLDTLPNDVRTRLVAEAQRRGA